MAEASTERNLNSLTQVQAAALVDVDRTTIRAWTEEGMPYDPPEKRGRSGSYRSVIVTHWFLLAAFRKGPNNGGLPKNMSPSQAIAYVHQEISSDAWESNEAYATQVRHMLSGYYDRNVIEQAIGFGLAFREMRAAR